MKVQWSVDSRHLQGHVSFIHSFCSPLILTSAGAHPQSLGEHWTSRHSRRRSIWSLQIASRACFINISEQVIKEKTDRNPSCRLATRDLRKMTSFI